MFVGDVDPTAGVDLPGELGFATARLPDPYTCEACGRLAFALPCGRKVCLSCFEDERERGAPYAIAGKLTA